MKNTRNTKLKSYEFGVNQFQAVGDMSQLTGSAVSAAGKPGVGNVLGSAGKGAATGAMMGSVVPGIGTAVGAVAGGVIGTVSGLFSNKKAADQRNAQQRAIQMQKDRTNYANLASFNDQQVADYYQTNDPNIATFALGGTVSSQTAFVNNNESMRTPDGNIHRVQGFNPRATDDVLANIPNGTSILSDSLKVPGTNRTFAQAGHMLMNELNNIRNRESIGTVAETTNNLNNWAVNNKYNSYVALQDDVRQASGKTNKVKSYALGTPLQETIDPLQVPLLNPQMSANIPSQLTNNLNVSAQSLPNMSGNIQPVGVQTLNTPSAIGTQGVIPRYQPSQLGQLGTNWTNNSTNSINTNNILNGVSNIGYGLASMAPVMYNLRRGQEVPEVTSPVTSPYNTGIMSTLSRRRTNLQPLIEENRRASRIADYNARNITNTGQNMAFRLANAAAERTANTNVRMQAQQLNNQYLGDTANAMQNMGNQYMQARNLSDDINARNRERTRDFTATAMGQLNQWAQVRQQDRNMSQRDTQKFEIWKQLAKYGLTQADLDKLDKLIG